MKNPKEKKVRKEKIVSNFVRRPRHRKNKKSLPFYKGGNINGATLAALA